MRKDIFAQGDKVLLLGEGNFSFSVALLNLGLDLLLTATCYESKLSAKQLENSELLKFHGVCILTGIDATKVHQQPILKQCFFDVIVFNFPHTGGKMKIQKNRELLCQFFLSSVNILSKPNGRIVVSLCRGQGADYKGLRTWSDSWQVVEMAGLANLLLVECSPFVWIDFPLYTNVGYRNLEKGFHSENAMVHVFSIVERSLNQVALNVIRNYQSKMCDDPLTYPYVSRKLNFDILRNSSSPTSFVLKSLEARASLEFKYDHIVDSKFIIKEILQDEVATILKLRETKKSDCLSYSFYKLSIHPTDMSVAPLHSQTLFVGNENYRIFMDTLSILLSKCHSNWFKIVTKDCLSSSICFKKIYIQKFQESHLCSEVLIAKMLKFDQDGVHLPALLIFADVIALKIFGFESWRQLWAHNVYISESNGKLMVSGICMHPVKYTFDITFSINRSFSELRFFRLLQDIVGETVISATKISEYCPPGNEHERSLCFRLSYLSYDLPMCRKVVIDFHQNILARALENILGVHVK